MNLTTKYSGTISILWNGETITQITIGQGTSWEKTVTRSYLDDGKIVFSREDAPSGTIWPLSRGEIQEIALMGGKIMMYADDLYGLTVMPEWWGVECDMAIEGECPEWHLSEDDIAGENTDLGFSLVGMILDYFSKPESQGSWDGEEDEDEGPDFV